MAETRPDPTNEEILEYLHRSANAGKCLTAKEIGQGMGYQGRKNVNPQLHALEKEGKVVKDSSKKIPLWSLPASRPACSNPGRPGQQTGDGQKLFTKTELRNGALLFSPTTKEEAFEQPSAPVPAEGGSTLQGSEMVCEPMQNCRPPVNDAPVEPLRELEESQPETIGLQTSSTLASTDVSTVTVDVPSEPLCDPDESQSEMTGPLLSSTPVSVNVSGLAQQLSHTSLAESTDETPVAAPPPVAKPRRQHPKDEEREKVLDFITLADSPPSIQNITEKLSMPRNIVTKILQDFEEDRSLEVETIGEEQRWSIPR